MKLNTGYNPIGQGINQNGKVIELTPPHTKLTLTHTTIPLKICLQILNRIVLRFKSALNVLIFEINSRNIKLNKTLKFKQEGETVVLNVRRLIYHGYFHFMSHIIGIDGIVWYRDGMTTESNCENNGDFDKFSSNNLLNCKGNKLILLVYARV